MAKPLGHNAAYMRIVAAEILRLRAALAVLNPPSGKLVRLSQRPT